MLLCSLGLSSVNLGVQELSKFVTGLVNSQYEYMQSLDFSNNRIWGPASGQAISQLLTYQVHSGYNLEALNL